MLVMVVKQQSTMHIFFWQQDAGDQFNKDLARQELTQNTENTSTRVGLNLSLPCVRKDATQGVANRASPAALPTEY